MAGTPIDSLELQIQSNAKGAAAGLDNMVLKLQNLASAVASVDTHRMSGIATAERNIADASVGFKGGRSNEIRSLASALNSFDKVNTGAVYSSANAIEKLAGSMAQISSVNFNAQGIINAAMALNKLGGVKAISGTSNLQTVKNDLISFAQGLNSIGTVNFDVTNLVAVISSISKLGGKSAITATANLPKISKNLLTFIVSLNQLQSLKFDTTGMTSLVASISKLGGKSSTTAITTIPLLTKSLMTMMNTLSKAPTVSNNLIQMTNALANLASQGNKVGIASNKISSGFNLMNRSVKSSTGHWRGLASAIGKFYATYFLVIRAIRVLGKAVNYSSDLTEVQNVVDVTFGKMSAKVEEFSKNSIKQLGMSELSVKQYASRFQAMGSAMGIGDNQIGNANSFLNNQTNGYVGLSDSMADVSLNLTKLTADMASFYDVSQKDVAEDLQAIFTGQTRPLREYGIDLTQATLKEWALKNGLDADISSMSQAEKTMLRYQYVLANTTAAQGDFARTSDTWANQIRILKQQFQQLGLVIGKGAIAAFKPFIRGLNSVLGKVISFSETVLNALGQIFGWKFEISAGGITDDIDDASSSMGDLSDGAGNTSSGIKDATDAAKKFKSVVLGIDELNLNEPDNDTGSGSGGSGGSGGGGSSAGSSSGGLTTKMEASDGILKAYESNIKTLYQLGSHISGTIADSLNAIDWNSVYEKARNFGSGLADFLNGLITPELFGAVGKTIANSLNTAIYVALSLGEGINAYGYGESVAEGINQFFKNFDFSSFAETLNVWVDNLELFIKGFADKINWGNVISGIKDFFSDLEIDTIVVTIGAIARKFGAFDAIKTALLTPITTAVSQMNFQSVAILIRDGIKNALSKLTGSVIPNLAEFLGISAGAATVVVAVIAAIGIAIKDLWDTSESFRKSVSDMWDNIKETIASAWTIIWDNTLKPGFEDVKDMFDSLGELWGTIYDAYESSGLKSLFEKIIVFLGNTLVMTFKTNITMVANFIQVIGTVVSTVIKVLTAVIDFINGVFSGDWDTAWKDLWTAITTIFSPITDWFSDKFTTAYNAIKSAWAFVGTWASEKWNQIKSPFKNVKKWFADAFQAAYDSVKKIWNGIGKFFKGIANDIISPIGKAVNGIISGINWVLGKVGSKTKLSKWDVPKFASGADGLPQDTVGMVNDQPGSTYREMIVPKNGKPFIPKGRNVVLPMEKGTKIMPADQTKALMQSVGIPHFAGGIGAFFSNAWESAKDIVGNIADYITHPDKILQIALNKFVDISNLAHPIYDIAGGAVKTTFDAIKDFIKGKFDEFVPKVTYSPSAGVEQWRAVATQALRITGQLSDANVNALLNQMKHESGGNPSAINNWDINAKNGTPSKGLMQVIDPTFRAYALAPYNTNIYDPLSNMIAAIRYTVSRYGSLYNGWTKRGYIGYKNGIGAISLADLPKYSVGGFPEDGLFMANSSELVGKFDGKNAVVNNYQIESGIEKAVYNGYMRAHSQDTREVSVLEEILTAIKEGKTISIDGREIVRVYDSRKARNGYAFT